MRNRKRRADELPNSSDESADDSYVETPDKRPRTLNYENGFIESALSSFDQANSYEDRLAAQQTQLLAKQRQQEPGTNVPAEGGIALSITCENFMCHDNLTVPLGPFMNFVIGHNGSGKSAVLTALTLCLGGKASSTSRGSSIKTLIKTGKDTARLTVRLKNEGDGFKVEQYGNEIQVERTFNRQGFSGYKLKSKSGKIISTKREELDDICDFYGLQVDNPMTVLTQDMAREFLSSSTNAIKYKLFAQGVQLEQLDQDYKHLKRGVKQSEAVLKVKEEAVQAIREHMENARKKLEYYNSSRELRRQHDNLLHQMGWAQVQEEEKILEQCDHKVALAEAKCEELEGMFRKQSEKFNEAHQCFQTADQNFMSERDKLEPLKDAVTCLKEAHESYLAHYQGFQRDEREIRETLTSTNKNIALQEEKIAAEKTRLAARDGGSHEELKRQIQETRKNIEALHQQMNEARDQNKANVISHSSLKSEHADIKKTFDTKTHEINRAQSELNAIRNSTLDPMKAFSPQHLALCQAIEREKGWTRKPIGPLGRYVKLRKPQWLHIVERHLGATLEGFLVTNREDEERLTRLKTKNGWSQIPQFFTPEKEFTINEPHESYDTILRILDISEPAVRRQLIIMHSAEQTILVEDFEEANKIMQHVKPQDYIGQCYTLERNNISTGYRVGGRGGGMGMTNIPPWNGRSRMNSSKAEEERAALHRLDDLKQERRAIGEDLKRCEERIQDISQAMRDFATRNKKLNTIIQQQETHAEDLQSSLDDAVADGNLLALEGELEELQKKKESYETQYRDFVIARDEFVDQNNVLSKLEAAKQDVFLCQKRIDDARDQMENAQRRRAHALQQKNDIDTKRESAEHDLDTKRKERDDQFKIVEDMTFKANQVHARVPIPPGETTQTLDKKLLASKNRLEALARELGGSEEELSANYQKALQDYQQSRDAVEGSKKLLALLMNLHTTRTKRWEYFLQHISARARSQFLFLMCERAFKGRLRLEHHLDPPELIIEVQPGLNESGNRGPKTLSGGEKSFSQICLLLALWEAMGSPIRCLDEFDVFMDPVNRSVSVNMMCKAARRSIGKQFILITPQSMNITESDQTKVFRMPEPRRGGQTTLDNFVH